MIKTLEELLQGTKDPFLRDLIDTVYHWRSPQEAPRRGKTGRVETITETPKTLQEAPKQPVYWGGVLERPKVLVDIGDQVGSTGSGALTRNAGIWQLIDYLTQNEGDVRYAQVLHAPTHHWDGQDPLVGQQIAGLREEDRPMWAAVRLDPSAPTPPTRRIGDIFWDPDNHCPSFVLEGSDTIWQGPMEDLLYGQNDSGVPHLNGMVGYIKGSQGQRPTIDISRADDRVKSLAVVFATEASIAASNSGYYTSRGFVRDVNTNGMAEGAPLWLQAAGGYGTSKPFPGLNTRNVSLGHVVRSHATTGSVFADITAYPFVDELSGVSIVSPIAGQVLAFNGTIWENATIGSGGAPIENHNDLSGRMVENCHNAMAITDFYALTSGQLTKRSGSGMVAAIPNTDYLAVNNPTYTGRLTGPTQYLEADEQILLAIRRPGGNSGRIHGIAFQAQNDASAWVEFGRAMAYISSVTAGAHTGGMRLMAYKGGAIVQALDAGPDAVRVGAGLPLQMEFTTVIDASRNITGATVKGLNAAGIGIRPAVALADGTFDDQDAATFRGTISAAAAVHDHTSITGSAAKLTTARSIGMTGDGTWSVSFDGSANASGAMTLASIIAAGGPVGSPTKTPKFTWDSKGRLTAVDEVTITPAWSSITSKPTTFSGLGVTMLASDIPNHASRHHWDGADPLDGQSIAGLRTTSSPTFLDVTAGKFYATSNGLGQNYRVGDDLWIGDIDLANTCRIAGVQNPAIAYIKFGSAGGPTLGFSGTAFTLSSGIILNGDLSFYNGAAVVYPGSGIGLRPASGIVRLVVEDSLVTANTAFLATSGQFANLVSGFVKSNSSGQLINGSILATDLPNHAIRHEYGGADPLAGQSISGLRTVDSPRFLNLTLDGSLKFTGYAVTSYSGDGFFVETSGGDQLLKMTVADGAIVGYGCHPYSNGLELGKNAYRWRLRADDANHESEIINATEAPAGTKIYQIPSVGNYFRLGHPTSGQNKDYRVPTPSSGIGKELILTCTSDDPNGYVRVYAPSGGSIAYNGSYVTYIEFPWGKKLVLHTDGVRWYV